MGCAWCCFCCLDEGQKVGHVMNKFEPVALSQAQPGALQKVVGRAVCAGQQPFFSPSGKPCVYFYIKIEEEHEWEEWERRAGSDKQERVVKREWRTIVEFERSIDFYIQDGNTKAFVQGTDREHIRIQGQSETGYSGLWSSVPPGVEMLVRQNTPQGWRGWHRWGTRTGNFRFKEKAFEINELVCALGAFQGSYVDAYTGESITQLVPFDSNTLDEKFFAEHSWNSNAISAWQELAKYPAVLLSDKQVQYENLQHRPPKVTALPRHMMVHDIKMINPAMYGPNWNSQMQASAPPMDGYSQPAQQHHQQPPGQGGYQGGAAYQQLPPQQGGYQQPPPQQGGYQQPPPQQRGYGGHQQGPPQGGYQGGYQENTAQAGLLDNQY